MYLEGVQEQQLEVLPTKWAHVIMTNCDITSLINWLKVDLDYNFVMIPPKISKVWVKTI